MTIVEKVKQVLCSHYWAIQHELSKDLRTMREYRVCIKCGKEDG